MPRSKYPQTINIGALELYNNRGELHIPDVQRELVWTKSQKQLLIDSLFKDFDIPKIYFKDFIYNDINQYDVIDGQQRLNAIFSFLNDEFALPSDSDPINGEITANKRWSELSSNLQIEFKNRSLDIVHLVGYSKEEIDETFLRLQNGTPLKAAEKRRAIAGNMRNVVRDLATNDIFTERCSFDNSHFAFEDVVTKILKQLTEGQPGSVSAQALVRFYEINSNISIDDKYPQEVKKALNFVNKCFKNTSNPKLKKYAVVDLAIIVNSMLDAYDLKNHADKFGKLYLDFLDLKAINADKEEEDQDPQMTAYSNAARADSLESIKYRQNYLKDYFIDNMPYLILKDNNRFFNQEQRMAIFRKSNGKCAICGNDITEDNFEADHIVAYSNGGKTSIINGQALCKHCNDSKSDS